MSEYPGLEIIGEIDDWILHVDFNMFGRPVPKVELKYFPVKKVTIGQEAGVQLKKGAINPVSPKYKSVRTYARCRIDFYVEEL